MTTKKDQYLADVWRRTLDYLTANGKLDQNIYQTFYSQSQLIELNDEKGIVLVPDIMSKQIITQSAEMLALQIADLLNLEKPIKLEVLQKSELVLHNAMENTPIAEMDDSEFSSMPIQADRTFDNFVVGGLQPRLSGDAVRRRR